VGAEYSEIFAALRRVPAAHLDKLYAKTDSATEYILVGRVPSPLPQHKGQPMYFAAVRLGKAYVSYHLMPLYMNAELTATISPALKKRMQGKTCFNFKTAPEPDLVKELKRLTDAGFKNFRERKWI
jgi:hypothetical protein